jgi:hypothetical protein
MTSHRVESGQLSVPSALWVRTSFPLDLNRSPALAGEDLSEKRFGL